MPMFNWRPGPNEIVLPMVRFRVYLAVALPLTAVVLLVWGYWMWRERRKVRKETY
jgi:hypothetical protein